MPVCSSFTLSVTVTVTQLICNGQCNGIATANPIGGTGPYTFSWNTTPAQTTQTATGLCAGNYTVTVTDAASNITTATVIVIQPSGITASVNTTATPCNSSTGTATVIASGGSGSLTYLWNSGETTATITNIAVGTYSAIVTDSLGCTQTANGTVISTGDPTANAGNDVTISSGSTAPLNSSGGGTYTWSPPTGLSCTNCANPIASPSVTTDYCVTVTDNNGCTDSACVRVNVETPCPVNGDFILPTAFSPNNDGHNDLFILHGFENCVTTFSFVIFDRWGEKVFETENPATSWDGIYKGKPLNSAVFVYYINATLNSGDKIEKKGNISLIR